MVLYSQLSAKFSKLVAVELLSIVRDDYPWDSKSVDNVLTDKVF